MIRLAALLCLLGACTERRPEPEPARPAPAVEPREPPRASVEPVVSTEPLPGGATYELHRFPIDLRRARFEVIDTAFDRTLAGVLAERGATVVVNGGYWDPERQPEGLTVVGGRTLVPFDDDLGGGVLVVDGGRARLLDAEAGPPALPAGVDFAQQCMPRLVVDGAVNVRATNRRADRTALCLREGGRALELVVARTGDGARGRQGPTLHALAEKLAALGCEQALNLDGGPSSGVAWRQGGEVRELASRVGVKLAVAVHLTPDVVERGAVPGAQSSHVER